MGRNKREKLARRGATGKRRGGTRDSDPDTRLAHLAIIGMLLLAAYFAVFGGEYSAFEAAELQEREARDAAELARTEAQIDSLRAVARALREDPETIERVARERYGMIRDGEILYRFQEATATADSTANKPREPE